MATTQSEAFEQKFFPELRDVRNRLTERALEKERR
jgi:hypothetical protein